LRSNVCEVTPERERGGREEIGEIFFLNHSFKLHKLSPNYSLSF